jgi:two-component system response regulator GlrR
MSEGASAPRAPKSEFSATLVDAPSPLAQRPVPRVEWEDGKGGHALTIEQRSLLGAAPQCDLCIDDRAVSRLHAELDPRSDGLWVRDLASRNGTYVNGLRVEAARLSHGHRLRVGGTQLTVCYEGASRAEPAQWPSDRFGPLRGKSPAMRELFATLARLAPSESSVLIQGETGSGKELVARAIHDASPRAKGPFVVVDCAALSETLMDAELFGHTRGAFTGALQPRAGAFEEASGGTVFLDEIGELPLAMQPKLLRVLESSTIRRVGETAYRSINVRFLSATHRDLLAMVGRGEFREDLYFRLAVFPVRVPALRERLEDLDLLARVFAGDGELTLDADIMAALHSRPWTGNVRELRNFMERARTLGIDAAVGFAESRTGSFSMPAPPPKLPTLAPPSQPAFGALELDMAVRPSFDQPFRSFREQWLDYGEREFVRLLLKRHDDNVAEAAVTAGVDRSYLYRLMRKHAL